MNYVICDAGAEHLPQLEMLERACFSAPWTRAQLQSQLPDDRHVFLIAAAGETVLGYANFLHVLDEGDIGNVAVAPEYRRQGIAEYLLPEDPVYRHPVGTGKAHIITVHFFQQ